MRTLVGYLPSSWSKPAQPLAFDDPIDRADEALDSIVPQDSTAAYDMREVIHRVSNKQHGDLSYFFLSSPLLNSRVRLWTDTPSSRYHPNMHPIFSSVSVD